MGSKKPLLCPKQTYVLGVKQNPFYFLLPINCDENGSSFDIVGSIHPCGLYRGMQNWEWDYTWWNRKSMMRIVAIVLSQWI